MKRKRIKMLLCMICAVSVVLCASCGAKTQENAKLFGYFAYPNTDWGMSEKDALSVFGKSSKDLTSQKETDSERYVQFQAKAFSQDARIELTFNKNEFMKGLTCVKVYLNDEDLDQLNEELKQKLEKAEIPYEFVNKTFVAKTTLSNLNEAQKKKVDLEKIKQSLHEISSDESFTRLILENPIFTISTSKAIYSEEEKLSLEPDYIGMSVVTFAGASCAMLNHNLIG